MIVYRPQHRTVETAEIVAGILHCASSVWSHDELVDLLIRFGEFESAVGDTCGPSPALRDTAVAIGRRFASRTYRPVPVQPIDTTVLPRTLRLSTLEGYAFYGLYPEMYEDAARRFAREFEPREVLVIGIRSIGASLSAVVAGTLQECGCRVKSYTVRPMGHPFDRTLDLSTETVREWAESTGMFAVVDEGPGLSGSSFACVLKALAAAGIGPERVVLFPSWEGDPHRFVNSGAAALWPRYRKYCSPFAPEWVTHARPYRDFSAGLWRNQLMPGSEYPAVQTQHEARKFLAEGTLYKFAGLGQYGEARYHRACALADAGYSPRPLAFENGFIGFAFHEGPVLASGVSSPDLAPYLAFRARSFPAARSVPFDDLLEMMRVNAGVPPETFAHVRGIFDDRPACAVDGRLLRHEFIDTSRGWLKTDSADHCGDHFFPGCADIAWDLAGASAEFSMSGHERDHLLSRYRSETGDEIPPDLLTFYEVAYCAFRLGYAKMAAQATSGTDEQARFECLARGYRSALDARVDFVTSPAEV